MKDYKLDIGDTLDGQIGLVSCTRARNKREALAKFKYELGEDGVIELRTGRYYRNVYLNWDAIKLSNIKEAK